MKKDTLTRLTELIEAHNVFVRERKPLWVRSLGIALLYFGLSCRQTAAVLSFFDEVSHEAARQWYHRAQELLREPSKRHRPTVAVDETKVKVEGRWCYLWAAVDTENGELLGIALTPTRDGRDAFPLHMTRVTGVHERADGAGGRRALVFVGAQQDGVPWVGGSR